MDGFLDDRERRELRDKCRDASLAALRALGGVARRRAIHDWALAHGGFTPRELKAPASEAASVGKYEPAVERQLAAALSDLKRDGLVENPRLGVWRIAGASRQAADESSRLRRLFSR